MHKKNSTSYEMFCDKKSAKVGDAIGSERLGTGPQSLTS